MRKDPVECLLRIDLGSVFQILGAAAIKARAPKEVRTKGVTKRPEVDDRSYSKVMPPTHFVTDQQITNQQRNTEQPMIIERNVSLERFASNGKCVKSKKSDRVCFRWIDRSTWANSVRVFLLMADKRPDDLHVKRSLHDALLLTKLPVMLTTTELPRTRTRTGINITENCPYKVKIVP